MAGTLTPAELKKPNSSTKVPRIEIMRQAMQNRTALIDANGKEFFIAKTEENASAIENFKTLQKAFEVKTTNGAKIAIGKIKKSAIFGGGGAGSGGGTAQTAAAESLQCFYCAAMLREPAGKPREYFLPSILKKHALHAHTGGTTFQTAMKLDDDWHYSSYESAKIMINGGFINKSHGFHRDDAVMKTIYAAKKKAFQNNDMTVLSDDKWNPGDIWAVDRTLATQVRTLMKTESVVALNAQIVELFKARKIVGISLKKLVNGDRAKGSVINEVIQLDKHVYSGAHLMAKNISTATFFRAKGGVIRADRDTIKVEIRTPAYLGALNAEITLATARGGRAGMQQIIDGIKKHLGKTFPENNTLKSKAQSIKNGDERAIKEFWDMISTVEPTVTKEEFYKEIFEIDIDRIHSKLGSTTLIYMLAKANQAAADGFISYIINYAGSKLEESSVYLKVYE